MRLDKFICKNSVLTMHEAMQKIKEGHVQVNHCVVTSESAQVFEKHTVELCGVELKAQAFRYILMHKPAETICSNIDEYYPSLFNYIKVDKVSVLHVAGRLDADTTGMVLITDDGRWSRSITLPTNKCKKVYRVLVSKNITADAVDHFKSGMQLQGLQKSTLPAQLELVGRKEAVLTITEGKFHQIKRMFKATGNRVVKLHREKIGNISLDIEVGQWRYLTETEVKSFLK